MIADDIRIADSAKIAKGAFIHPTVWIDEGVSVGTDTKVWHFSHLLRHSQIGERCVFGQNVAVGPKVVVGDGCKLQNNVTLYEGVTLEQDVFCGPSCVFTNVLTPRAHVERKNEFGNTLVKRGATIGANATVVCGHTLGAYCMIAAGAVVTKDVLDYALIAGVPGGQIGWVSRSGDRLKDNLICPRTDERYELVDGQLMLSV